MFPASLQACLRASFCALIFPCCGLVHSSLFFALDYCRLSSDRGCRGLSLSSAPRLRCRGLHSLLRLHDVLILPSPRRRGGPLRLFTWHFTVTLQLSLMDGFCQYLPFTCRPWPCWTILIPLSPPWLCCFYLVLVAAPTSCACRHLMSEFLFSGIILIHHSRRCPNRLAWLTLRPSNRTPWIIGFPSTRPMRPTWKWTPSPICFPLCISCAGPGAPASTAAQHSWDPSRWAFRLFSAWSDDLAHG